MVTTSKGPAQVIVNRMESLSKNLAFILWSKTGFKRDLLGPSYLTLKLGPLSLHILNEKALIM